ncbi:hypothetical protein [Kribbia dieselivorans]|uniref:hypothetical protein n=1 Tax=Kribbia dieselivorans TaxID=331526 RepID=UPI0012ED31EB|nr:hypothetical protein [Kribbia dieselivorans]
MSELAARADSIVVGTLTRSFIEEAADEEGVSDLVSRVADFKVSKWLKGDGPTSIPIAELQLNLAEDEAATLEGDGDYVLFLEKNTVRGAVRYNLVGGVGAYRIGADGALKRTEKAMDTFPASYGSLSELDVAVAKAPTKWTEFP